MTVLKMCRVLTEFVSQGRLHGYAKAPRNGTAGLFVRME